MKLLSIIFLSFPLLIGCNQATGGNNTTSQDTKTSKKEVATTLISTSDTTFTFNDYATGKIPAGWSKHFTGKGNLGNWEILDNNGQKLLAQTSKKNSGYHFDILVNDALTYKNLEITVKFKGTDGKEDQGGGPVWRYQDADNYYIARANPLENNFRVYKVIDGNRIQLESANLTINTGKWYTLKVTMEGNKIKCYFDGVLKLETTDDSLSNKGKIGLWTKADAVTYFDNLQITTTE